MTLNEIPPHEPALQARSIPIQGIPSQPLLQIGDTCPFIFTFRSINTASASLQKTLRLVGKNNGEGS